MDIRAVNNFSGLQLRLLLLPLFLLLCIFLFLLSQDALSVDGYINVQKELFFAINHRIGQFPTLLFNLTQLGDALVFLSFLSIFFIRAPRIWEALFSGLVVCLLCSSVLKKLFAIPRPCAVFDPNSFIIVGQKLQGQNSLPSGHSIIVFTIMTILMYGFMPNRLGYKIAWTVFAIGVGVLLVLTRVGVGAHYPIDVLTGSIIGYFSGLSGIFISRKYKIWSWIRHKKFCPIFILLFLACCVLLVNKMATENLVIFYLSFASFVVALYKITVFYVKK